MEDMARLALVEQSVRDSNKFNKILFELLALINNILENPHDYELRTIKSDMLKNIYDCDAFNEYLKYIGFQWISNEFIYPKEQTLSKLRMAQAALERKISFCCGSVPQPQPDAKSASNLRLTKKPIFTPANILTTNNPLLLKLEVVFNNMIKYENEELLQLAREQIPVVTLQLMALDRVREQQRKLKAGEITGHDMPFDIALLMELMGWFKHKFFTWVDKPPCEMCEGPTQFVGNTTMLTETESCRLELYKCTKCKNGKARFPRYNDVRTLLRSRRGRCGEWANCFTLICRAMGYDTRYVYDTTDHVWCEVFDYDSNAWLHVDPCEGVLNTPLMYCHGWKKKLSYVFAFSRDDLQDVTWRYTMNHKEVLKRRTLCDENELVQSILSLREHRQRQVTEARRKYLAKRALEELVQLMVERKPSEYESHGRISGSKEWRSDRGEIGTDNKYHVFRFTEPGTYSVGYYTSKDRYEVSRNGTKIDAPKSWKDGVYETKNIFRKEEFDWNQTYLAREEGEDIGSVSWKLSASEGHVYESLQVRLNSMVIETGVIDWTITFDDNKPIAADLGEAPKSFDRQFSEVTLTATLSGGLGDVAWQHAQLFRQRLNADTSAMEIHAVLHKQ